MNNSIDEIRDFLSEKGIINVDAAVILGSGLGDFKNYIQNRMDFDYAEIPGMPEVTVAGHAGRLYYGQVEGKNILAFGGRFHSYEGHGIEKTLVPVRVAHAMQAKLILISNAAGSINYNFRVGDLMLINDYITPMYSLAPKGTAPYAKRFDLKEIRPIIQKLAADLGIHIQHGTYCYVKGPTYETKAEIRAFRTLGADVVGMSTAPELIEATRLGTACIGITLVTNMSTGVTKEKLDHSEVKLAAESRKDDFASLVSTLIKHSKKII